MVEIIFDIICLFISLLIFSFVINEIGQLMDLIKKIDEERQLEMVHINKFMSHKEISSDLQARINDYIKYLYEGDKDFSNGK